MGMTPYCSNSSGWSPLKLRLIPLWFALAAAAFGAPVKFAIPAQPAAAALQLFIKQSGTQVAFSPDDLKDVAGKAVTGDHEPAAALDLLLKDTGFKAGARERGWFVVVREKKSAATGSINGTLLNPGGQPAEGVQVMIRETGQGTVTGRRGEFTFTDVPAGTFFLAATAEGYQPLHITDVSVRAGRKVTLSRLTMRKASDLTKLEPFLVTAETITQLDEVAVTGAKVRPYSSGNMDLPRTIDDPKPYFIFDAATIEQTGAATVEDFLSRKLTMMSTFSSGSNSNAAATAQNTGTASVISMRGLGATQTLILVNGRRLPVVTNATIDTSPDVNSIPMSLIDRIEVLPSSASGIYGGGAVAGVINIITKRNYTGGEIKLSYDNTFSSDSAKRRIDLMYGFTLEEGRTRVMLFASKTDANSIAVQDRYSLIRGNFARAAANNPAYLTGANGLLGTTPLINSVGGVPLVLKTQYGGQSLGTGLLYVPAGYRGLAADGVAGLIANAGKIDPEWPDTRQWFNGKRYALYNLPQTESFRAEFRRQMLPSLEVFFEFSYDRNFMNSVVTGFQFSSQVTATVAASAPNNPFNQAVSVKVPTDSGVGPFATEQPRRQAVGGFTLKLPHQWELLGDYSWNANTTTTVRHTTDILSFITFLSNGTFDPFIDIIANPDRDTVRNYLGTIRSSTGQNLREASLRAFGPLGRLFFIRPTLALSVQRREEERKNRESSTVYAATPALNSFSASLGASQTIGSYYAELNLPLVPREKSRPGLRLLDLQLTGRRDDYANAILRVKGTGGTSYTPPTVPATDEPKVSYSSTNPGYGLRYKPVEDVMLRVSYAKGYLPPTASQLVPGIASTFASNLVDPRRGGASVSIIAFPVGGNPDLIPETSDNWSAGLVFTPKFLPGLRFSVDYTIIKKANNIATLNAQVIVNNESLFSDRVKRGLVAAGDPFGVGVITGVNTTTLNLFSTSLEAYDVALGYQKTTATMGTFTLDALATVTPHYSQRITLGAPMLEYVGTPSSGGPLKLRSNLSAIWTYGRWSAGWTATYYDGYKVPQAPFTTATTAVLNNGGPTVASQMYHDVFVRYRFGQASTGLARMMNRTELLVGVRNVFNKAPAFDGTSLGNNFFSPFGDARMASYYITLKRSF